MNQVILIGRLVRDVELTHTQNGTAKANFSIAISNGKDRPTDFINCTVWEKQAENMEKYTEKGSQVAVNGSIKTDTWEDSEGNRQHKTYVLVRTVTFLEPKKETKETTDDNNLDEFNKPFDEIDGEELPFDWS